MKRKGEPIVVVTAYDASGTRLGGERRPFLVGGQLADMPDELHDLLGAGDDRRAGTQQHMAPDRRR